MYWIAIVLYAVGFGSAILLALAIPFSLGLMAYDIHESRKNAAVGETEARRRVSSGGRFEGPYGYSRAVVAGDACFVAGTSQCIIGLPYWTHWDTRSRLRATVNESVQNEASPVSDDTGLAAGCRVQCLFRRFFHPHSRTVSDAGCVCRRNGACIPQSLVGGRL